MSLNFIELTNEQFSEALKKQAINEPTAIQEKAIPLILSGADVIASSETGTGKTLAYLLPILMSLDKNIKNPQAVVIVPTHELASQVHKQLELLIKNSQNFDWVNPALIIGGASMSRQLEKMKQKPRIVIGSVGRILEIIRLKKMTSHFVKTIVLDEADRLLDAKSLGDISLFIKTTLKDRQIVLFSASNEEATIDATKSIMNHPEIIDVRNPNKLPESINHIYFKCEYRDKIKVVRKLINLGLVKVAIIFLSNPSNDNINKTKDALNYHGIKCSVIYGDVKKHDRRQALLDFREGRVNILIASDLAARGLDFRNITHVINYDMPEDVDIYLHRAGRCGRMGEVGECISLVTDGEKAHVKKISQHFGIRINEKTLSYGNMVTKDIDKNKEINKNMNTSTNKKKEANFREANKYGRKK